MAESPCCLSSWTTRTLKGAFPYKKVRMDTQDFPHSSYGNTRNQGGRWETLLFYGLLTSMGFGARSYKWFPVIHNNSFIPGKRGRVVLGEVWGDLPFLCGVVIARTRMIWNRFMAKSRGLLIEEVLDVPRKCMDGSISSSQFLVLTRSSKSYLVSNWRNILSILNRSSGLNDTCEFRALVIAAPRPSQEVAVFRDDHMLCRFASWLDLLDWCALFLRDHCRLMVIYPLACMCVNFFLIGKTFSALAALKRI